MVLTEDRAASAAGYDCIRDAWWFKTADARLVGFSSLERIRLFAIVRT